MDNMIESIINVLRELEAEYKEIKGLILTEDDLKCQLYSRLNLIFNNKIVTADENIYANQIHTEVSFYNNLEELRYRPDIVVIDPNKLSILHGVDPIYKIEDSIITISHSIINNGKQFEFYGNSIIFELKFCKNRSGISNYNIESYKKDIEKIKRIQELAMERNSTIHGFFVVFNKTSKKTDRFSEITSLENETLKIFYGTGDIVFPNKTQT